MQTWHIPGVSIGVVRDGKVLLAKGYGFANIELGASATADTVYEILSLTKQFTAAAIIVLVEEGKIGLDDTVAKYLPDSPASWKDVTVRHLLTHTSGIMDFTDIPPFFEQLRLDATPALSARRMLDREFWVAASDSSRRRLWLRLTHTLRSSRSTR